MRVAALALFALLAAGCRTGVLAPVPEPLAEAMPWSSADRGGAFLGLTVRENDSGSLEDLFFSPGVRVVRVVENSPADALGIEPGDVLLRFGDEEVNDPGALGALLALREGGDRVALELRRDDSVYELVAELESSGGGAPEPELLYRLDPARSGAGWATDPPGVRLVSLAPHSPLGEEGLAVGDVVTALDGSPVRSDRELIRRLVALQPGSEVELTVRRPDGDEVELEVDLLEAPEYVAGFHVPILVHYAYDPDKGTTDFTLLDLWLISLFEYHREGREKRYSLLKFLTYTSGVGELVDG